MQRLHKNKLVNKSDLHKKTNTLAAKDKIKALATKEEEKENKIK